MIMMGLLYWTVLASSSVLQAPLRSLNSFETSTLQSEVGQPFVTVFFKENCEACDRLIRDHREKQIILIATEGSRAALKRHLLKSGSKHRSFKAGQKFLDQLNPDGLTPRTIFWNEKGQPIEVITGYQSVSWQQAFARHLRQ